MQCCLHKRICLFCVFVCGYWMTNNKTLYIFFIRQGGGVMFIRFALPLQLSLPPLMGDTKLTFNLEPNFLSFHWIAFHPPPCTNTPVLCSFPFDSTLVACCIVTHQFVNLLFSSLVLLSSRAMSILRSRPAVWLLASSSTAVRPVLRQITLLSSVVSRIS